AHPNFSSSRFPGLPIVFCNFVVCSLSFHPMPDPPAPDKKAIPREFHSEYEDRPFRACSQCGEPLAAFRHYQINKAWRNGECVFEYVFCEVCRDRMLEEFSEESKANLLRHQEQHLRDVHGTGECAFCGRTRA